MNIETLPVSEAYKAELKKKLSDYNQEKTVKLAAKKEKKKKLKDLIAEIPSRNLFIVHGVTTNGTVVYTAGFTNVIIDHIFKVQNFTLVGIIDGDGESISIGLSFQNPNDLHEKTEGILVALERAKVSKFTIPAITVLTKSMMKEIEYVEDAEIAIVKANKIHLYDLCSEIEKNPDFYKKLVGINIHSK